MEFPKGFPRSVPGTRGKKQSFHSKTAAPASAGVVSSLWISTWSSGSFPKRPWTGFHGPCIQSASIDFGAVAQLGERLICIQEVAGSIPTSSTSVGPVLVPADVLVRVVLTMPGSKQDDRAAQRAGGLKR